MMAWPDERDEQLPQRLYAQLARERMDLSRSVEETLAEQSVHEDEWDEELDSPSDSAAKASGAAIIRPRLTLQSRALVAVRPQGTALPSVAQSKTDTPEAVPATAITSHPTVDPETAKRPAEGKRRLGGRATKVRLEAAPKQDTTATKTSTDERITDVDAAAVIAGRISTTKQGTLSGSGVFERGQGEVAITNPCVTATSVVVVTLIGDPGPVVVQYISLKPQEGFTVHLSSPAQGKTPFNYVILLGELF
jgi:hypothetical protein